VDRPERWNASVSGDASFSTTGSYRLLALADFPAWWDGWRASLAVAGIRGRSAASIAASTASSPRLPNPK